MTTKEHWERVYATRATDTVSWYQPHAATSLRLIEETGTPRNLPLIDVGGGASVLVDNLVDAGYTNLTVLDLSGAALSASRTRLGARGHAVHWLEADILSVALPFRHFALWHDRAVFHFLTDPDEQREYARQLRQALKPGGHAIIATFAEDGPTQCSGLPVARHSMASLEAIFEETLELVAHHRESHLTPAGASQSFLYCQFRRAP
ncbi:class I SAM-dependent methyltransferase [Tahibacter amnicola]|uniref:Class I SAM-dependent methyltransferase n=1 Tax=Tahibacter amnicola TaxID=2976241 RepID=A0ABY6BGM7_9GAMM|nr:class I SAM-dependent methyltransferase [Tahibacter amnicola]UXI68927.1 class I SAM-dependent methyltransferase [Tahibacter amnicola]